MTDHRARLDEALALHERGELEAAEAIYRAILDEDPRVADARHLLGLVAHAYGYSDAGLELIEEAIELEPEQAHYQCSRGNVLLETGDPQAALQAYRRGLELAPGYPEALDAIGNALRALDRNEEALAAYDEALASQPDYADALNNKGSALVELERFDEAAEAYQAALRVLPDKPHLHFNLGNVWLRSERYEEAVLCYQAALVRAEEFSAAWTNMAGALRLLGRYEDGLQAYEKAAELSPDDPDVFDGLGLLLMEIDEREAALEAFERVLELRPGDEATEHIVAALGGAKPAAAPASYVRDLFDSYAGRFDDHITEVLEYRMPRILREAVSPWLEPGADLEVIDLGCGTGLCGPLFADLKRRLVGVDLSPRMLEKAADSGAYDELEEGELVEVLQSREERFGLALAADVFVYLGDLEPLFEILTERLEPGAYFVFSTERTEAEAPDGYELQANARYAHRRAYVRGCVEARGFEVLMNEACVGRTERNAPVPSDLWVLRYGGKTNV